MGRYSRDKSASAPPDDAPDAASGRRSARAGSRWAKGPSARPPAREAEKVLQQEIPCPNCGQPMLAGWGATCGNCKPAMARPKTIAVSREELFGAQGTNLGWLVVLRSPETDKRGQLFELDAGTVVLSRAGAAAPTGAVMLGFKDEFMSVGHCVIRRPLGGGANEGFTVSDRQVPGPSSNGTFVNAHKLAPGEVAKLADGDILRTGTTELQFKCLWLPPR